MHFNYKGLLFVLLTLVWGGITTACHSELEDSLSDNEHRGEAEPTFREGDSITITGQLDLPEMQVPTRAEVSNIQNLTLLVFDENHRFLYSAPANLTRQERNIAGGENQLPAQGSAQDNKAVNFSAKLLSSTRQRIIHFIANYNFPANWQQDYLLKDTDEGQLINRLSDTNLSRFVYWRSFSFAQLNTSSFNNRVFRLLRNQAVVQVAIAASAGFDLKGFCVHNAPDRGTLAPYVSKETLNGSDPDAQYRDVLYSFPSSPTRPTLLSGVTLHNYLGAQGTTNDSWKSNKNDIAIYEYRNSEADRDKQIAIILYGAKRRANGTYETPGYYKVDLKQDFFDAANNYLGSEPYDVVRNHLYKVTVNSVATTGYPTPEKAIEAPAGNNLFASVELKEFSEISDGKYMLDVSNSEVIITQPQPYTAKIAYKAIGSNTNELNKVNVYYNRKAVDGAFTNDPFIQSVTFNRTTGELKVTPKTGVTFPTTSSTSYTFVVIADNKAATNRSIIQRTITIVLKQPYKFNATLINGAGATNQKAQGERVDLTFDVPGSIPETLFPYKVTIAANGLTPYVDDDTNQNIKLVIRDKKIYYEYIVLNSTRGRRRKETLHFKRNATGRTVSATISSPLFADQTVTF